MLDDLATYVGAVYYTIRQVTLIAPRKTLLYQEDVQTVLQGIARIIQVPWNRKDISIAHRLELEGKKISLPTSSSGSSAVLLEHLGYMQQEPSRSSTPCSLTRTSALASYMAIGNEHLLPFTKLLLSRPKAAVKEERLAFPWVKDGKLFVKQSEDRMSKRIKSQPQLESAISDSV